MIPCEFCRSSVGKKAIMAISGLILLGFVIAHLAGNLLIFLGPDALNTYAKKLRDLSGLLWAARAFLLFAVGAHIWASVVLTFENRNARPIAYEVNKTIQTSLASRAMMVSGVIVFVYVIYHLLHFTFRVTNPEVSHLTDSMGRHDVYSMVVLSFQNVNLSLFYCIAMILLCLHLGHGASSWLQSLGLNHDRFRKLISRAGLVLAVLITIGYLSIPVSVLCGVLQPVSGVGS